MILNIFFISSHNILYFTEKVKGAKQTRCGEAFRERPLKKLFGTLRGFSAYRADAGRWLQVNVVFAERVKSRCRGQGIWTDILVVLFPLSFCLKKKAPKKSRHKGGLRRDSLRSYSAQFPPLCIPPYDCSADSESICLYPKRSASIKPPVSKRKVSRLML